MKFTTFETLVKINTQDNQSKLPPRFDVWQVVIDLGIKKIEAETHLKLRLETPLLNENGDIPLIDDEIAMCLVFYVAQMFCIDLNLKQKYIQEYEDAKVTYLWNKI